MSAARAAKAGGGKPAARAGRPVRATAAVPSGLVNRRDTAATVALVLAAAIPLAMVPGGYSRFVLAKLALGAAVVVAAALARPAGKLAPRLWAVIGAGAAWLVVAAAVSAAPLAQLVGRWPRYEGLVALPVYAGALWAGARLLGPGERAGSRVEVLTRALAVSVSVVAVVAVAEVAGLRPLGGQAERPGSFLGNASHLGSLGVLLLGVGLARVVRRRDAWGAVLLGGAGLAVAASGSRAALAGAGLTCAMVLARVVWGARAVGRPAGSVRRAAWLTAATVGGLAVVSLALPGVRDRLVGADELAGATVSGRWLLWRDTWRMVVGHPLAGVGPSGFVDAIAGAHSEQWWRQVGPANPPDSPHSVLGQVLSAGGLPLLAVAVAGLVLVARAVWRSRAQPRSDEARVALIAGGVAGLLGYLVTLAVGFTTAGVTLPACLLLGAVAAQPWPAPEPREAAEPRRARAARGAWLALGAVWAVVLAVAAVGEVELARGTNAAAVGRAAEADAHFSTAQHLRPWDPDVALLAASAFAGGAAAGDTAEALLALTWTERGLAAVPTSVEVAVARARALGALGRPADGLALLEPLLAAAPLDTDLLTTAAVLDVRARDLPSALARLRTVTEVAPEDVDAWTDVATIARALGDDALAERAQATADRLGGAQRTK